MNGAAFDTHYTRTATKSAARSALNADVTTDVCIIGGGLAGLACAIGLAERGLTPVVLEARQLGYGASGRNGGFVLAGYAAAPEEIEKRVGAAQTTRLFDLTRTAQKTIRRRIDSYAIDCYPVDGHLKISWFDDVAGTRRSVEKLNTRLGLNAEFWPREKVRDICRSEKYFDGIFFPDYFHMHPLNYLLGLATALEQKGGHIFENTAATSVTRTASGFQVITKDGKVTCAHVVYCGSAYFNGIEKRLARACLPVSTYVMVTEPIDPAMLSSAIRAPYAIRDSRWADDYYRILPDNSLLWGGRVGLGRTVPKNLGPEMLSDLLKIYPQLGGHVKVRQAWAGVMGYTVHKMPHIGRFEDGAWYCTNFGGNGVGPTTAGGEVIAAAIAQGDETYRLFEPFGFEYTGGVLGPLVAQAVYHSWELHDKIHEFADSFVARKRAA